jgi:hypothetical protein
MTDAESKLLETPEYKKFQELKKAQTNITKGLKTNDQKATAEIKDLFNYEN